RHSAEALLELPQFCDRLAVCSSSVEVDNIPRQKELHTGYAAMRAFARAAEALGRRGAAQRPRSGKYLRSPDRRRGQGDVERNIVVIRGKRHRFRNKYATSALVKGRQSSTAEGKS